jgi:hypothetical protein
MSRIIGYSVGSGMNFQWHAQPSKKMVETKENFCRRQWAFCQNGREGTHICACRFLT